MNVNVYNICTYIYNICEYNTLTSGCGWQAVTDAQWEKLISETDSKLVEDLESLFSGAVVEQ